MAAGLSKADGLAPIVTFVSMIVLGIIISEFVITDPRYQVTIILFSFFMGMVIAALELRAIIRRNKIKSQVERRSRMTDDERKQKLARYVADLFDEDIPFDDEGAKEDSDI